MCISLYTKYIVLADPPVHSKAVCNKSTIALPKQSLKVFSGNTAAVNVGVRAQAWKLLGNVHMCPSCAQACIHLQEWPSSTSSSSVQGVSKLEHTLCTNWALAWAHVYISKQFSSLGTPTSTAVRMLLIFLL